ncbi:hypothetical protein [Flavobacterium sp.]|uniref:hypothetical protein n=1 Tax=Flavobacterium sp. TaxID=239 RepID=UPI00391AC8B2
MHLRLKNSNITVGSSDAEESKPVIISNEEKELLDLLADFLVQDIINQVKNQENEN